MFRTLALLLVFTIAVEAAPRTRAIAHPPAPLAITGELTTADPVLAPTVLYEQHPRVATGGGIGLVVWNGGRKAVRVDAAGRPFDFPPFAVLQEQHYDVMSDLVFHDGAFTFAAMLYRLPEPRDLVLARVTPAGEVSVRRIAGTPHVFSAALATNGRELLLAVATSQGIDTHRIASDGSVTLGPRLAGERPKLASDGRDFLAVHGSGAAWMATRILRDGTAGATASLPLPDVHDVVWNGTGYVVLGHATDVFRGVRVSAAGVPGEALFDVPASANIVYPSFSWTGSEYRLLWKQRGATTSRTIAYDLRTARVAANGQVIESVRLRESADVHGTHYSVGSTDVAGSMMVWGEGIDTGSAIIANLFTNAGNGMPVELVTGRPSEQYQSAVAQNGAATLVAFVDSRRPLTGRGSNAISIARVNADGTRQPGPGTMLYPTRGGQDHPGAAWNGVDSWIVWREPEGAFAARVDSNGILLDREPIQVSSGALRSGPQIACGPADCLAMWADGEPAHVRSMLLAPNGTKLDAQPVDQGPGLLEAVVRAGSDYAFTASTPQGFVLRRLRGGSTLLGTRESFGSAVAWSGSEFLVVWRDADSLLVAHVDASGNFPGTPHILGDGLFPVAIWTGRHFLVAFDEMDGRIGGARIRTSVERLTLSVRPGDHDHPALAIHDDGTIVVSYTRHEQLLPVERTQRNLIRLARD